MELSKVDKSVSQEETIVSQVETHGDVPPDMAQDLMQLDTERAVEARGKMVENLPRSYWYSASFLGSYLAIILATNAGIGSFSLLAPILGIINDDIGPSPNLPWVATGWVLTQGVIALVVGRLTDIFGRRWIFIAGSVIGLVGSIFGSQAQTINQLIGASVINGFAGGIQVNFTWVTSEIVPMKWRYVAVAGIVAIAPYSALGPKIALSLQNQTGPKWRSVFYLLMVTNVFSIAAWFFFYHPPTFKMLHRRKAMSELLKTFDWIGLALYVGSTITFLLGFQWGGSLYPWKSGHVIGTILTGSAGIAAFILWELNLKKRSQSTVPFVNLNLLKNFRFMVQTLIAAIGGAGYFGLSIIWPAAVTTIYTGFSPSQESTMLNVAVVSYIYGQVTIICSTYFFGTKWPLIISSMLAGPFLAAVAADPLNLNLTMGLLIVGAMTVGGLEGIGLVGITFPLQTQEEIGTAGGLANTIRTLVSTIAIVIYSTTLNNRLNTTVPANVKPAAESAGLPASSIAALIEGLSGAIKLTPANVPGLNAHILDIAETAYRSANAQAYKTVFLVTLAFTGPAMILCWFAEPNDKTKDNFVAGHIHTASEEKFLEEDV